MTGTIIALSGGARTGTIRSNEGVRIAFGAADVLGDFDALAVGHTVSFDVDRAQVRRMAMRVFHEPTHAQPMGQHPGTAGDLRFMGFQQSAGIRTYRFARAGAGDRGAGYTVTVDMTMLLRYRIGVQEVPSLCLHKLAADLRDLPESASHELGETEMAGYARTRADADSRRKRAKHSFAGRRGAPPPGPADRRGGS